MMRVDLENLFHGSKNLISIVGLGIFFSSFSETLSKSM